MSDEFDRIRPPRRRVRARGDDGEPAPPGGGRQALFSGGAARSEPAKAAGAAIRCSRCAATSPLDVRTAMRAALPLMLVAPWRREPVFARCPACRRRSWLAIEARR